MLRLSNGGWNINSQKSVLTFGGSIDEEKYIIINYGVWFEALTNDFQCYTETQRHFVDIAKRKDFQNASTEYEKTWVKYLIRLDALTSNDGNMIEDYSSYREPDEKKIRCF